VNLKLLSGSEDQTQPGHRNMTNFHHCMDSIMDIQNHGGAYSSKFAIPLDLWKELKSLIKKNGHYAILGVYRITTKGCEFSATDDNTFVIPIRLMKQCQHEPKNCMLPSTAASSSNYKKVKEHHH